MNTLKQLKKDMKKIELFFDLAGIKKPVKLSAPKLKTKGIKKKDYRNE